MHERSKTRANLPSRYGVDSTTAVARVERSLQGEPLYRDEIERLGHETLCPMGEPGVFVRPAAGLTSTVHKATAADFTKLG